MLLRLWWWQKCAQVIWEHADRLWLAGDVMCRVLKYAQSFAIMSSVNMLVVLSIDRHQAIRRPLSPPPSVRIAYISIATAAVSRQDLQMFTMQSKTKARATRSVSVVVGRHCRPKVWHGLSANNIGRR